MLFGLEVGAIVRVEKCPEWGIGQVQSIIGDKVTVNFEHSGKQVLVGGMIDFLLVSPDRY